MNSQNKRRRDAANAERLKACTTKVHFKKENSKSVSKKKPKEKTDVRGKSFPWFS